MLAELDYNFARRSDTTGIVLYTLHSLCAHYFTRISHQLSELCTLGSVTLGAGLGG